MQTPIQYRDNITDRDLSLLRDILESTGYFYEEEINIALELAGKNLKNGPEKSGYSFEIAELEGRMIAFACYGKIPGTKDSFDLYWIAVHEDHRGKGIGRLLLRRVEDIVSDMSGKHIWLGVSSRPLYNATRKFYRSLGYRVTAELYDFYAQNDNKIIFVKRL